MSLLSPSSRPDLDRSDPHQSVDELMAGSPLEWSEAASIIASVAASVAERHAAGDLDLGLDPWRIRLNPSELTVHLDESPAPDPLSHPTINFTAPERFRDVAAGPEADVYGLGAMLLFLVSGVIPFSGTNNNGAVATMARLTEHPTPLYTIPNDVPGALVELIRLSMLKSPAERTITASHFAEVADALARGDEVLVVRPKPAEVRNLASGAVAAVESDSSLKMIIGGLTLFLVLIIVGAGLGVLANQPDPVELDDAPTEVRVAGLSQVSPVAVAETPIAEASIAPSTTIGAASPSSTAPAIDAGAPIVSDAPTETDAPAVFVELTKAVPDEFETGLAVPIDRNVFANDAVTGELESVELTGLGALPLGVVLAPDGSLNGAPIECGSFDAEYRITSSTGSEGTSFIRLSVTGCGDA